jgi:hypothetical protein
MEGASEQGGGQAASADGQYPCGRVHSSTWTGCIRADGQCSCGCFSVPARARSSVRASALRPRRGVHLSAQTGCIHADGSLNADALVRPRGRVLVSARMRPIIRTVTFKGRYSSSKSWTLERPPSSFSSSSIRVTTLGAKAQATPSFHAGGGFIPDDEEFGDFMLSGIILSVVDMTLEAFAHTWSQTVALKDAP